MWKNFVLTSSPFQISCRILIAEVCELERDWKVFRPHRGNCGLKFEGQKLKRCRDK